MSNYVSYLQILTEKDGMNQVIHDSLCVHKFKVNTRDRIHGFQHTSKYRDDHNCFAVVRTMIKMTPGKMKKVEMKNLY